MDKYWLNDYSILFKKWYQIIPHKNMSRNEILNSLTRFSIFSILIFIFIKSYTYWFIIPIAIFITSFLLGLGNNDEITYEMKCKKPTGNNPFMNAVYSDNNLPACHDANRQNINKLYEFNLYKNSNDIFGNKNLKMQFYTTPYTTNVNNITKLGNMLYNTNGNCKYNGKRCLQYEDERFH